MRVDDFEGFYWEVHERSPLPWQRDLVREIVERRSWPATLDVPTGLGKTSLLDIAVFLAALDVGNALGVGRRRIFFVVDRKIVVDQAEQHALHVAHKLRNANAGSILAGVRQRLQSLGGAASDDVLPIVKMRGGATWEAAWLTRPDSAGVVTGTVDQVGSRLFFRGYGVSPRRWPIDAALTGNDSLILVDEAHLAVALTTSLGAAQFHDQFSGELGVLPPSVVQMSATTRRVGSGWSPVFDEAAHLAHPVASQRLLAGKSLTLRTTKKAAVVRDIAAEANAMCKQPAARVLVVCNTVDRAREVHGALTRLLGGDVDLSLLIGRSRPLDRERVVDHVLTLFGADRGESETRAVLVATQTVEVGVDLDATGMVTESAAWDALVQRIGRVNRRGLRDKSDVVVLHYEDPKAPVYGAARERTAEFLTSLDSAVDVSSLALRRLNPPAGVLADPPVTPLLLPSHLDAWSRTAPAPANDAPLEAYLHGIDNGVAPVTLVWRDGLANDDGTSVTQAEAQVIIDAIPPRAEESVEVPLGSVRRWLMDEKPVPINDVDDDDDWFIPYSEQSGHRVLRRGFAPDGSTEWVWASAGDLRPADLVVVPTQRGGLDRHGWAPESDTRVRDVSELAALRRGQPVLRVESELPARLGLQPPEDDLWSSVGQWLASDDPDEAAALAVKVEGQVSEWLSAADPAGDGAWKLADFRDLAAFLARASLQRPPVPIGRSRPSTQHLNKVAILRLTRGLDVWRDVNEDSEDATAHLPTRVTLAQHSDAVAGRAQEIAINLSLPDDLVQVVTDAARWHDVGKVEPRFQAMLFGGDPISAAVAPEPIAKSGMPPGSQKLHQEARRRSGLPRGARHEVWSEALVAAHLGADSLRHPGHRELVLHLVGSHHGYGRPFARVVRDDATHELVAEIEGERVASALPRFVDVSAADRFQRLNQRYGRWGLALLEAIVRCADMTVSGEGS